MNADICSNHQQQSQLEEVKESLNRFTLNFKSEELQKLYEEVFCKQKISQLLKIYILLTGVSTLGIIQQAIVFANEIDKYLLIFLISISCIFLMICCLLRFVSKYTRIWNTFGIFAINIVIIITSILDMEHLHFRGYVGFYILCIVLVFILLKYNNNFGLIFACLIITFITICLLVSVQFYVFMGICFAISILNLYQSEYTQKKAFWFERFNFQQNHIIENVVTSSLFYIRYNKKEERLEFQRGNKRFCEKFEVKDDDSLSFFLKNTKITQKSQEEQTIHSMWNSVNNTWKSSLDGLIHKLICEQDAKTQNNNNNNNNYQMNLTNIHNRLKEKSQTNSINQPSQQEKVQNISSQPFNIAASNGQSIYLSKSIQKIKNLSLSKGKQPHSSTNIKTMTNLQENFGDNDKDLKAVSEKGEDLEQNITSNIEYMSRQNINIISPQNSSKRNFLFNDDQGSVSKKDIAEEDINQEKEEERDQINQLNHKTNKFKRMNSGQQSLTMPSPYLGLKRTFTWRQNQPDTNVYKAKYVNQSGEKIKFLMNDTYLAVSIEKEDQIKKYKQLKNKLTFFESVFTQLVNECKNKASLELSSLRKMIPLTHTLERQLSQQNVPQQYPQNQISSQLLSLNIEDTDRQQMEKLQKQVNTSLTNKDLTTVQTTINTTQNQQGLSATSLNTTANTTNTTATTATTTGFAQINLTKTAYPLTNQVGVLKKPSQFGQQNQQQSVKQIGIQNLQDIRKRDSLKVGSGNSLITLTSKTDWQINEKDGQRTPLNNEKTNFSESIIRSPTVSLQNGLNINNGKQQQQFPFSSHKSSSSNSIQVVRNSTNHIQKGQLQQILNYMLYLTYNGRFTIMNYNYFFEFFKKRTHLEISQAINLSLLIESVLQMFKQEIQQKKIQVITDYYDKDLHIITDQNALRQIIFNLLQNALQYTPSNGYIALKTEQDLKYSDCVKLKIRNTFNSSSEKSEIQFPELEDCKFKIDDMISYYKKRGKVNLGLRVSQKLIKTIGPTDKIVFKSDTPDYFQVGLLLYNDLSVVQQGGITKLSSQKALISSYIMSQEKSNGLQSEKTNLNIEKVLSGSNNFHAIQTEGAANEHPKKNLLGLYQTAFRQQINPFNFIQASEKILNSDQSFDSYVDKEYQSPQNEFERRSLSADRFKHLS